MSEHNRRGKEGVVYLRRLPTEVKNQFKAACARRGQTMTDVLVAFMRRYAEGDQHVQTGNRGRAEP